MKLVYLCVLAIAGCQSQTESKPSQVKTVQEDTPEDLLEGNRVEKGVCISYKSWDEYDSFKEGTCRESSSLSCLSGEKEDIVRFSTSVNCKCYALETEYRKYPGSSKEDRNELEDLLGLAPTRPSSDDESESDGILVDFEPYLPLDGFYKQHPECRPKNQPSSEHESENDASGESDGSELSVPTRTGY